MYFKGRAGGGGGEFAVDVAFFDEERRVLQLQQKRSVSPAEASSTNWRTLGTMWTILACLDVARAVGIVYDGGLKDLDVAVKSVRRSVRIM